VSRNRDLPTDAAVAMRPAHTGGYRDFGVPGLLLRVGARKRTWELRIEGRTAARRVLGEFPKVGVKEAIEKAREIRDRAKAGIPIDGPEPGMDTIATSWPLYRARLTDDGCSPKTLLAYGHAYDRLTEAVRHRPLRDLLNDRVIMADEQKRIRARLANYKRGGLSAAAQSAVFVSALFGFMRDRDPSLIGDAVSACQTTVPVNGDLAILGVEDMPTWYAQVRKLKNPIVQEALLFTLLTGLRRGSLESLKWSDLDLKRGCIRIRIAKGGADKAFDLILSRPMLRCLWRARRAGRVLFPEAARTWIFASEVGHVTGNSLTKYGLAANHALRRAYATAATLAGVDEPTVGRLLNHGGKSVTARYIRDSHLGKMLASAQADISTYITNALH
jgi:integrase